MKRKDKRPKRDSNANPNARPHAPNQSARDLPRRAEHGPSIPNRKTRRSGRLREPAAARLEPRRDHSPPAPIPPPPATLDERSISDEVGFGDSDFESEEAFELGIGSRIVPLTTQYGDVFDAAPSLPEERSTGDVQAQIRALEARLDGLIRQREVAEAEAPPETATERGEPISERRGSLARSPSSVPAKVFSEVESASRWLGALMSPGAGAEKMGVDLAAAAQRVRFFSKP